jgi:hypothetical protein
LGLRFLRGRVLGRGVVEGESGVDLKSRLSGCGLGSNGSFHAER